MMRLIRDGLTRAWLEKSRDIDKVVADFIAAQGTLAKTQIEDFAAALYLDVMLKIDDYPEADILRMVQSRLDTELAVKLDLASLETIYAATAAAAIEAMQGAKSIGFLFDAVDVDSLAAIRDNFFWLQSQTGAVQSDLKAAISEAFKGNRTRAEMGEYLRDKFKGIVSKNESYFKGVSDHIILQSQNIARINQGEKYGVPYYQVVARMDSRTTPFCRSMHLRIIPAAHLTAQVKAIQGAKSTNAKKKAAAWPDGILAGALPKNVGTPPYHFRCRTRLQPMFELPEYLDENSRAYLVDEASEIDRDALKKSIKNVQKEGILESDPSKRVVLCGDGTLVVTDKQGKILSMEPDGKKLFGDLADTVIYSKVNKGLWRSLLFRW